jgi:hypothetical protein
VPRTVAAANAKPVANRLARPVAALQTKNVKTKRKTNKFKQLKVPLLSGAFNL